MPRAAQLPGVQDCLSLQVAWALAGTGLGLPCQHRAKLSRNIPQKGSRYPCLRLEGQEPPKVLLQMHPTPLPCPLAPVPGEHAC